MKFVGIRLCWDVCDMLILTVIVVARLGGLVVKRGRAEVEDGSCERSYALLVQRTASVDNSQSRYVTKELHLYRSLVFGLLLMFVMVVVRLGGVVG